MTGLNVIVNNNLINNDQHNNELQNNVPVGNAQNAPIGNPAKNYKSAVDDGFVVFDNHGTVIASDEKTPTLTISMNKKIQDIKENVAQVSNGSKNMTFPELMRELVSYSELTPNKNDKNSKCLFRNADGAVALDRLALSMTQSLIQTYCFSSKKNLDVKENQLKNELNGILDKIMNGNSISGSGKEQIRILNEKIDALKEHIEQSPNHPKKVEAKVLLDDIKAKFSSIVSVRYSASLKLRQALQSGKSVSFSCPEEFIGMGNLLKKYERVFSKIIEVPKTDIKAVTDNIISGQKSLDDALLDNPNLKFFLNEMSEKNCSKLKAQTKAIVDGGDQIRQSAEELKEIIRTRGAGDDSVKLGAEALCSDILDRIKELSLIRNDSENLLNEKDRTELYSGAGKDHDSLVGNELSKLSDALKNIDPKYADSIGKLMEHRDLLSGILTAVDYSPSLFMQILKQPRIADSLITLSSPGCTDAQVRDSINALSQLIFDNCKTADNSLLVSLLKTVPVDNLSPSGKVIMDNLPVKLELTKDALACINFIIHNNNDIDNAPIVIDFDCLKTAYHKVCESGAEIEKLLKKNHCYSDLKNVENILLKAAYHDFLAEHPNDPDCLKSFAENSKFKAAMGISDHDSADTVDVARYKGFDPTNVNIKNTEVTTFLKAFNIMMSHSDFVESCSKIPPVHLANKVAESLDLNILNFLDDVQAFYDRESARTGAKVEELKQLVNPRDIEMLRITFNSVHTSKEKLQWFNDNMEKLTGLFINTHKTTLTQIENNNKNFLNQRKHILENLHLEKLVEFSRASSQALGSEVKPIANVEELLRDVSKIKGSDSIGFMVATLNQLSIRNIDDLLPEGRTFLGLTRDDFLNTGNTEKIAQALKNAPAELTGSADYKFAFFYYAKLESLKASSGNNKAVTVDQLATAGVKVGMIKTLIKGIVQDRVRNVNGFNAIEGTFIDGSVLLDFCKNQSKMKDADRLRMLENFILPDDMFKPENNIFVGSSEGGVKLKQTFQKLLNNTINAIKRGADTGDSLRALNSLIASHLAGDATRDIANALVYLSPYFTREFSGDTDSSFEKIVIEKFGKMFKPANKNDRSSLVTLRNALMSSTVETSRSLSSLMLAFRKKSRNDDSAIDTLMQNPFAKMMADNALRQVAYNHNFSTYADFKYKFSNEETIAGKSKNEIILEAVDVLKSKMAIDDVILEKMLRQLVSSDLYFNDTSSRTKHAKRAVRSFGRAVKASRIISSIGRGISAGWGWIKGIFGTRRTNEAYSSIAANVISSIEAGSSLVHTKDNRVEVKAGKNLKVGRFEAGVSVGVTISAGSNLEIERSEDNRFTFVMSAGLGAKLGLTAGIGSVNDPTISVTGEAGGQYQRGVAVTFDSEEKASDFLTKIIEADVQLTDLQRASQLRSETVKNFEYGISAQANIVGSVHEFSGEDDTSEFDVLQLNANAEFGQNFEWKQESGSNSHKFSRNVTTTASVGVEAGISLKNAILGNSVIGSKNPDDIEDESEKDAYNSKKKTIEKSANPLAHMLTNHEKLLDEVFSSKIISEFSDHEYSQEEKKDWKDSDDLQKYEKDPSRFVAESIVNLAKDNFATNAVSDIDSMVECIAKKIPGVKQVVKVKEKLSELVGSFNGLFNKLDTANLRLDVGINIGDDADEIATIKAGATYSCNTTTSYETNLMQNDLKTVEKTVSIEPENKGSETTQKTNNVKFLSTTMKNLGFTEAQINKAVSQLNSIQVSGEKLESMEIVRVSKKESLAKIKSKIRTDRNISKQINKHVNDMKDSDFRPVRIVFNTSRQIDETSTSFGAGAFVRVSFSSEEQLSRQKSYEVEF
jgi:ribosomal protein S15P/S13E